jgi:hypothetical protein
MNLPSIKTLDAAFPGKGKEIRMLLEKKTRTTSYEDVHSWIEQCWHRPKYSERLMLALNEIIEGHGVEVIWGPDSETWPEAAYVNTGDYYNATLMYDCRDHRVRVTTVADFVERNQKRTRE